MDTLPTHHFLSVNLATSHYGSDGRNGAFQNSESTEPTALQKGRGSNLKKVHVSL